MTFTAGSPVSLGHLGYAYAMAGRKEKASELLVQLEKLSEKRYVSSFYNALIFTGFGDKDLAFEYLEKAFEEHESFLSYSNVFPYFDTIRDDPRFHALLKKIGLPTEG